MIKSVYNSDTEILNAINQLYLRNKGFELDPTYGKGRFYKDFPEPPIKGDIRPLFDNLMKLDTRDLYSCHIFKRGSIKNIIFDPPFLIRTGTSKNNSHICKEYGSFESFSELFEMYDESLYSFAKIMPCRGILVFKCQDTSNGGQNHFIHNDVLSLAENNGFKAIDLFIKVNDKVLSRDILKQRMARKHHSYFWVFRKK